MVVLRFGLRCRAVKMTPHAKIDRNAHGHQRCGAQYQDDKQDLDHHRESAYQMKQARQQHQFDLVGA